MKIVSLQHTALVFALVACLAACGKDASDEAAAPGTAAPATSAAAPEAASTIDESPLRSAEIDAYVRGMQQEIGLLAAAGDKVAQARATADENAQSSALMEMATLDTEVEGAKASGLSQQRYLFVKNAVDSTLGKVEMQAALKAMGADAQPSDLPAEQRKEVEEGRAEMEAGLGDPYQGMAADVAATFKARQAELAELRARAVALRFNAASPD